MAFSLSSEIVLILVGGIAGCRMNKIHHRRSLTRTHTEHVVIRMLNAEDCVKLLSMK